MFDISWTEFLLIGVVALMVIGPKELPGVMRTLGQWTRKIRSMAAPRAVVSVAVSLRTHATRSAARSPVWSTDARILSASSNMTSATSAGRVGHQR